MTHNDTTHSPYSYSLGLSVVSFASAYIITLKGSRCNHIATLQPEKWGTHCTMHPVSTYHNSLIKMSTSFFTEGRMQLQISPHKQKGCLPPQRGSLSRAEQRPSKHDQHLARMAGISRVGALVAMAPWQRHRPCWVQSLPLLREETLKTTHKHSQTCTCHVEGTN